jgi:uncharacterized membrane protein
MGTWLITLRNRSQIFFWVGLYFIAMTIFCFIKAIYHHDSILGTGAYLKPLKYFTTLALFSWSIGWLIHHLYSTVIKKVVSISCAITMLIYSGIILLQSNKGVTSHYNLNTPFDKMLYYLLILMAFVFFMANVLLTVTFFNQKKIRISQHYTWGIRMGLLFFTFTLLIGFLMIINMSHTVGGEDGGKGLPFLNWSSSNGDLRVSHILGVLALQIIPLMSYYWFKTKTQVIAFSVLYITVTVIFLITALMGLPLIP